MRIQHNIQKYIQKSEHDSLQDVLARYSVRISQTMLDLIGNDTDGPIGLQFIPNIQELDDTPHDNPDPIGDHKHSPVKGIVHRHPNRVLLKLTHICPVYCRFCFRKTMVGETGEILNLDEQNQALEYIENHKEIQEVILTGGDPFMLSARRLKAVCERLHSMDHLDNIRFHTRVPLVSPELMSDKKIEAIQGVCPLYILIHVNHAREFTPKGIKVCESLVKAGFVLLSQTALLKGVNADCDTLHKLFRTCIRHKIKPYYLHHLDYAPGTSHFRISIRQGQAIMKELMQRCSGLAMPTYVLDIPGGYAKVPLHACRIETAQKGHYVIEDPQGRRHHYIDTAD